MVIEVSHLSKSYKNNLAVNDVSFFVKEKEIFGLIGPNGAGKTTIIECIEGLKIPDSGNIAILGLEPTKNRKKLYHQIGIQLQETAYQYRIKVNEICKLYSSFYDRPFDYRALLKKFLLEDKINSYVRELSGGQKQKLFIILALIPNPRILFLDELTTGLDPKARRDMWRIIKDLQQDGRTIFMTTHYMEEAEHLCDRVAIIYNGKIAAIDTVENLINESIITEKITFQTDKFDINILKSIKEVKRIEKEGEKLTVWGKGDILVRLVNFLSQQKIKFKNFSSKRTNLEDVYLKVTGQKLESEVELNEEFDTDNQS